VRKQLRPVSGPPAPPLCEVARGVPLAGEEVRLARVRAKIAQQPAAPGGDGDVAGMLRRICVAAAEDLRAFGVGICVVSKDGVRGFSVASDLVSQQIEDFQLIIGEGASTDVLSSRRPVVAPDLTSGGDATRWPIYSAAMHDRGVRAVFALPLQVGGGLLGVFDIFRARPGMLSDDDLAQALTFAEVAMTTVLDGHAASADGLAEAMVHRAVVFQAQGMVMVQLGVSLEDALVRLRARAYADGRPLTEVAQDVVSRRLRFDKKCP
jgi:ANTAR domain/GAF domain